MSKKQYRVGKTNMRPREIQNWVAQQKHFVEGRQNEHNPNSRAAARRRKQMLAGKLKASNGVVLQFDDDTAAFATVAEAMEHAAANPQDFSATYHICTACGEPTSERGLCTTCAELLDKQESTNAE